VALLSYDSRPGRERLSFGDHPVAHQAPWRQRIGNAGHAIVRVRNVLLRCTISSRCAARNLITGRLVMSRFPHEFIVLTSESFAAANGRGLPAKLANTDVLPAQTTQARAMQEFFVGRRSA
jgi:hypothetical protein